MSMRKTKLNSLLTGLLLVGFALPAKAQLDRRNAENFRDILAGAEQFDPCNESPNTALPGYNDPANVRWRAENCSRPESERPQLASNARWDHEYQTPRQQIAAMLGCDEDDPRVQNAVADSAEVANMRLTPVHRVGREDRQYVSDVADSSINETAFAAVGKIYCEDPNNRRLNTWSTATLVGDQSTISGAGHFRTHSSGHIFPISHCRYYIYSPDGTRTKSYGLDASTVRVPHEPLEYYNSSRAAMEDWAVIKLTEEVDTKLAQNIKVRRSSFNDVLSEQNSFMVAYHHQSSGFNQHRRVYSPNCRPQRRGRFTSYFQHYCDTAVGSSGGLIFAKDANNQIVAIGYSHMESSQRDEAVNYGQAFSPTMLANIPNSNIQFASANSDANNI